MGQGRRKSTPRWRQAVALLPLVALSGAWSGNAAAESDLQPASETGPLGTPAVPDEIFDQPASVALPEGFSAPSGGLPQIGGTAAPDGGLFATTAHGIPDAALSAYQRAAAILNAADPGCNLDWTLIAAIGRVESDHGRFGGNALGEDGVARPGIYGIPLNGSGRTARVTDTDGGALDNDTVYDRAVGPMQFIPGTWSVVGVDADEDGVKNPQDIEDAATATGVYLCAGSGDLSNDAEKRAAVYRYNHSTAYVEQVLAIEAAYAGGNYTPVPNGTASATTLTPVDPNQQSGKAAAQRKARPAGASGESSQGGTAQAPPADDGGQRSVGDGSDSTGGSSSGNDGGGDDKADDGSESPAPGPSTSSPTPQQTVKKVEETAKKTVEDTKKVAEETISLAKATALCDQKLGDVPVLGPAAIERCGQELEGKTLTRAQELLSGTVKDVIARLGLL